MEVILHQDITGVGKRGAAVKVKDGFARNYLLPRGLALKATRENLDVVEKKIKDEHIRLNEEKKKAQELADKLSDISCTVPVDTHDDDKLYGSITSAHIASGLEAEGFQIDKKQILLDEPIKALGIYNVGVILHPEVKATIKVWVVKSNG